MAGKRKRKRASHGERREGVQKRQKIALNPDGKSPVIRSALLAQFYPQVLTLRQYLLSKLPTNSKVRAKKIRNVGKRPLSNRVEEDKSFSDYLDRTLIGVTIGTKVSQDERWRQWNTFSQRADESVSTLANLSGIGAFSQSEVVDFAIWQLFSRKNVQNGKIIHLLCQGFQRDPSVRTENTPSAIPGIASIYPNSHVTSMKAMPWPRILTLLGTEGERAMLDLLLDCGIFLPVPGGQEVYHQLSGQPLGELRLIYQPATPKQNGSGHVATSSSVFRTSSEITIVRNRMLYARAALNAFGGVRFGLRHIHILNRYCTKKVLDAASEGQEDRSIDQPSRNTTHIMMYIFPRQFGLHNVFTSAVDSRQTVQPFQDYTLREDEISKKFPELSKAKIPKRLRVQAVALIEKLQIQHSRCAYKSLLDHYCPIPRSQCTMVPLPQHLSPPKPSKFRTQPSTLSPPIPNAIEDFSSTSQHPSAEKNSMMDHATPNSMVSTFCRAVMVQLIPNDFWGAGEIQEHNKLVFHRNIDRFVELRRFESLSLHEITQGLQIKEIHWLGTAETTKKNLSASDNNKRREIFYEFIYYLFDSLLIPLIRANFHVTESNVHRYRLFYFRHDVWKSITEPALASLKLSMFEEVKLEKARRIFDSRPLGFSHVRLLPKATGVRPIMNLRRRPMKKGSSLLGSSINSVLAPVYNVFTYEKASNPKRLGSTLSSVGDLYSRLKKFRSAQDPSSTLYFAKLDVTSAFDTIPQVPVVSLMRSVTSHDEYRISKHLEMKPGENFRSDVTSKPLRKWAAIAHGPDDLDTFEENLETELSVGRKNVIFVESVVNQFRDTDDLLNLLAEHVHNNMVKIGKKFYRQKQGIPQGSVLSSLLCNYFYADLELRHLGFLTSEDSLLLRLIDDFLLITTNSSHAKKFLQIMHNGVPEYGVTVNPDKTLTNFEVTVDGSKVRRLVGSKRFPFCGTFIHTNSLNITRDRERRKDMDLGNSLTVEFSKTPGKAFHRKILNSFKIQSHAMFLDTSFNSLTTVLSNIYNAFIETANKTWIYVKCLPAGKQPGTKLMIKTITDLSELAFVLVKSKGRNRKNLGYRCAICKVQVEWLAINGFKAVLSRKQSKFAKVLEWLDERIYVLSVKEREVCLRSRGILRLGMPIGSRFEASE